MFCPKCGAQQPDGVAFCGACGAPIGAAAPAGGTGVAPAGAATGGAAGAPAGGASPFGAVAAHPAASNGFGLRATVMVVGALLTIILMFQAWFDFPVIGKYLDLAMSSTSASSIESVVTSTVSTSVNMPGMFGVSNALRGLVDVFNQQVSSYSSLSDMAEYQSFIGSINLATTVMTIMFVLWVVCLVGVVAGAGLKMFTGNDFILFVAFAATAVLALISIIVGFVMNGAIEGAITSASGYGSNPLAGLGAILAPAFGAYLTLIVAGASAVGTLLITE